MPVVSCTLEINENGHDGSFEQRYGTSSGHSTRREIDASSILSSTCINGAGRPSECNTIDDLGDKIVKTVLASGKDFYRIDVTFDRYKETSIECATKEAFSRLRKTLGFFKLNCQSSLASTIAGIRPVFGIISSYPQGPLSTRF